MTEYIHNHDHWLDPPEEPTHGACSNCGEWCDYDDMHHIGKYSDTWLCAECYQDYLDAEAANEN